MHTARQLQESAFEIRVAAGPATRAELLPDWTPFDRLCVVLNEPVGAVGASHLIQLAITAFYDVRPERRDGFPTGPTDLNPNAIYPEIYLFHVGGRFGDHSAYDFWPSRKEVFLPSDARAVLDALNDRAITRLAVPDAAPIEIEHQFKEPAAALDRIRSAFAYSATGRVADPQIEIKGLKSGTEANPRLTLDPDRRYTGIGEDPDADHPDLDLRRRSWPRRAETRLEEAPRAALKRARERRDAIRDGRLVTETYRFVPGEQALSMLAPPTPPEPPQESE